MELVKEAWRLKVTKPMINALVDSMVRRMEDVLAGEGCMTGF